MAVLGNHDYAVLFEPTNFNYGAELASHWTRRQLEIESDQKKCDQRWGYLGALEMRQNFSVKLEGQKVNVDLVHASPRKPINEYVFPDDVYTAPGKINALFDKIKHLCFIGHTHLPGVFLDDPDFYTPEELGGSYPILPDEKAIINVGSVGQPRDRDNRASYAYVDDTELHFVRLDYDYEAAAKKIYEIKELENFEGDRLFDGK